MTRAKRFLAAAAAAAAFGRPLPAAAGVLAGYVDAALRRSPALEAQGRLERQAQEGRRAAQLSHLPRLEAGVSAMRGDDPVYVFGSLLEQGRFGPSNFAIDSLNHPDAVTDVKRSLTLGLPLFTAFELETAGRLAAVAAAQARAGQDAARQGTRLGVVEAALSAARAREEGEALDESVAAAQKDLADAESLRRRGLVLGSDFAAAQAIEAGLEARRAGAQARLAAAQAALAELTGQDPAAAARLTLSSTGYALASPSALAAQAAASRPELQAAALGAQAARLERRRERASILPRVDAFASLQADGPDLVSGSSSRMLGVRAALPLDPGYLSKAAAAAEGARAADASRRALEQAVRVQAEQAFALYAGAAASLPALGEAAGRARRAAEQARPLYREGRLSVLDALRAEEGAALARAAYLDGLYSLNTGYARALLAAGRLDDAAVAELDARAEARP